MTQYLEDKKVIAAYEVANPDLNKSMTILGSSKYQSEDSTPDILTD